MQAERAKVEECLEERLRKDVQIRLWRTLKFRLRSLDFLNKALVSFLSIEVRRWNDA